MTATATWPFSGGTEARRLFDQAREGGDGAGKRGKGSWHHRPSLGDGRPSEAPLARRVRRTTARPTRPRGMRSQTATPMVLVTALSLLVVAPVLGAGPRRTTQVTWQPVTLDDAQGSVRRYPRRTWFRCRRPSCARDDSGVRTAADAHTWHGPKSMRQPMSVSESLATGTGWGGWARRRKGTPPTGVWNSTDGLKWWGSAGYSFENGRMVAWRRLARGL